MEYRNKHLMLTRALRAAKGDAEQDEQLEESEDIGGSPGPIQATPKRMSRDQRAEQAGGSPNTDDGMGQLALQVQGLRADVLRATQRPELELEPPELMLHYMLDSDLLDFTHPTTIKLRNDCPISGEEVKNVKYQDFAQYLSFNLGHAKSSQNKFMLGVRRLLNTVGVVAAPNQVIDFKAYLVALYKENTLVGLMDWAGMDLKYGWARDIVFALVHFAEFGIYEARRLDQQRVLWHIEQLAAEVIEPWNRRACQAKKTAGAKRQEVVVLHNSRNASTLRSVQTHNHHETNTQHQETHRPRTAAAAGSVNLTTHIDVTRGGWLAVGELAYCDGVQASCTRGDA